MNFGSVTHGKIIEFRNRDSFWLTTWVDKYVYYIYILFTDILFIKSSRKTFIDFLKNTQHKVCKEGGHAYHVVLWFFNFLTFRIIMEIWEFLSWNISEKSLNFFKACLWGTLISMFVFLLIIVDTWQELPQCNMHQISWLITSYQIISSFWNSLDFS